MKNEWRTSSKPFEVEDSNMDTLNTLQPSPKASSTENFNGWWWRLPDGERELEGILINFNEYLLLASAQTVHGESWQGVERNISVKLMFVVHSRFVTCGNWQTYTREKLTNIHYAERAQRPNDCKWLGFNFAADDIRQNLTINFHRKTTKGGERNVGHEFLAS